MTITVLRDDDYRGTSGSAIVTDGVMAHTHIALLNVKDDVRPCYIKFYPAFSEAGVSHRGLVNEIVGHVIASEVGLDVPVEAGLIIISSDFLASKPEWVDDSSGPVDLIGWWTQDMNYPSIKSICDIPSDGGALTKQQILLLNKARDELIASSAVHEAIAFDSLIANGDRNLGNMLQRNKGSYILIDHGLCLTGDSWSVNCLDPDVECQNKVKIFTLPTSEEWKFKNLTMKAHDEIVQKLDDALSALRPWLDIAVDKHESDAVTDFIRQRGLPGHFAQKIGLIV